MAEHVDWDMRMTLTKCYINIVCFSLLSHITHLAKGTVYLLGDRKVVIGNGETRAPSVQA